MNVEKLTEIGMTYGSKLIFFLISLIITWIIAGWLGRIVTRVGRKNKFDETLSIFFGRLTKYIILMAGVVSCLSIWGIQTASFAAMLAGAGLAIGMALQGTLGNFASGVMLLIFRPFTVGDVIKVGGTSGKVCEIALFNIVLDTADNRRIIVPNGSVFGGEIENITYHSTRRVSVSVGSDYGADIDKTREILLKAASGVKPILNDPTPAVVLTELGDSSINWSVRVWVKTEDFWDVQDKLTRDVKYALDNAAIGIPFPQMDVHLDKN